MPERTEIEKLVRWQIASDIIYRQLKSLGEKGVRRLDKTAKNIVDLLEAGEEIGDRVIARIEEKEEEKARTLREGIEEFKRKYLQHGKILEGMIAVKRMEKNNYLVYGLNEGYKLGEEDYLSVMMDLGFDRRAASSVYPHILGYSEKIGKAIETTERSMLIK